MCLKGCAPPNLMDFQTRAQVHACYDILGTDARIFSTDCAQLDRHIDRCWTVLRSSHGPQLGVPLLRPLEEMDGQVPHGNNLSELCHNDAEGANMSAGSAGFPLSIHGRRPSVRPSGQGCEDEDSLDLQYPPSDSIRYSVRALPAPNPCRNVPGLWFVKVGASASKILEAKFVVDPEFAAAWDLLPTSSSTSAAHEKSTKAKLCVVLLCLPTAAASALYSSLITTDPTPEGMATAVAGLETAWPQDGTLLIDINKEGIQGKTWLPYDIDPTLPLDVTHCIQAGSNVIRFIQLTSMEERTFILYASRREPDTDMFDDTTPTPSDNPMFNFDASVTVTRFL
ncbi:hypothetical protein B0H10DRAFT_2107850 [Mycena sp. CBHHK59/15]|nr:hypothetical protein B0H10DRAFT_2107850 [Mycena sp. CBHHK59/15]